MKNKVNKKQVSASGEPNDTAQLRAENQRVSEVEAAPGGALADAPCSASSGVAEKQDSENQSVSLIIGNDLITITVQKTKEYKDRMAASEARFRDARILANQSGITFEEAYTKLAIGQAAHP